MREFHAGVFVPNEAILFASGDLRTDDFVERVRVAFGDWPAGDARAEAPPPPSPAPPERRVVVVDRPDLGQAQLLIGHEGIARTDENRIAVNLMDSILGSGGFSSRLMRRIRAEGGLTYGVYSMFSMRRRPGPFFVSVATRAPEAGRVVDLVLSELGKVSEAPPTADEIQRAKSGRAGRFALGLETSAALATALVDLEVYGLPGDSLDTFRARLRAVGAADVERAARAHLFPERAAIVAVGPAEVLQPLLERFGAVEVVDP